MGKLNNGYHEETNSHWTECYRMQPCFKSAQDVALIARTVPTSPHHARSIRPAQHTRLQPPHRRCHQRSNSRAPSSGWNSAGNRPLSQRKASSERPAARLENLSSRHRLLPRLRDSPRHVGRHTHLASRQFELCSERKMVEHVSKKRSGLHKDDTRHFPMLWAQFSHGYGIPV